MGALRQLLLLAIVFCAFVAVYSLEETQDSTKDSKGLVETNDTIEARRRRHRFNHLWCKKTVCVLLKVKTRFLAHRS